MPPYLKMFISVKRILVQSLNILARNAQFSANRPVICPTIDTVSHFFLQVTIPCSTCEPTCNRHLVLSSVDVYQLPLDIALAGWDRSLRCKGRCRFRAIEQQDGDKNRYYYEHELLGPGMIIN